MSYIEIRLVEICTLDLIKITAFNTVDYKFSVIVIVSLKWHMAIIVSANP